MKFLSIAQVCELTTLCKSSVYNQMDAGSFPKSYRLAGRRVGWLLSEVEEWVRAKIA
jgi:prophage regulatory protein